MGKMIGIMQPTYMPWMGYFSMIDQTDAFVFLDNVQLAGRSWQVRNKIKLNDREKMLTIPMDKSAGRDERMICNTPYLDETWKKSHLGTIQQAYRKSPFYKEVMEFLEPLYLKTYSSVGEMNTILITKISRRIGIDTPLYLASELPVSGHKDELLAEICQDLKADSYLSAQGSAAYIEKDTAGGAFVKRGIELFYLNYEHPKYRQQGESFIPYIGIYDLLFNVGFNEALIYIRRGNRENYSYKEYRIKYWGGYWTDEIGYSILDVVMRQVAA